jgi:hypothetical protein
MDPMSGRNCLDVNKVKGFQIFQPSFYSRIKKIVGFLAHCNLHDPEPQKNRFHVASSRFKIWKK